MENNSEEKDNEVSIRKRIKFWGFIVIWIFVIVVFTIVPTIGLAMAAICFCIQLGWKYISFMLEMKQNENEKVQNKMIENKIQLSDIKIPDNMPFPYAIISSINTVVLYNEDFKNVFYDMKIDSKPISELINGYKEHIDKQRLKIGEQYFDIYFKKYDAVDGKIELQEDIYSICMIDVTENELLKNQIRLQEPVVALIFIDNFEEVLESIEESNIPLLTALIDRKINTLATDVGGVVKKFEKDRYIFVLSQEKLEVLKDKKFDILNQIRDINIGEHIPVTLSIGIGVGSETMDAAMKSARAAIDLALGRGGDQVLIKDGEKYLFYGGKSGEVSHNARIRARVKADALSELIGESSEIFAMGHKQADLDSLGSSIGICKIARTMDKKCYIVLDHVAVGIKKIYKRLMETEGFEDLFITSEKAAEIMSSKTLLVITDTHRHSMVESSEILDLAKKVVVFDHHRKSTDFIEKAVLIYHEPYASSTSELVTEIIQYIGEKIKMKAVEADALLAGITVDTKNFCVKTGAITFEAAAYLRRNGADSTRVRLLFQNDMDDYKAKATAVRDAELFEESFAISVCPSNLENSVLTAAQAADDLLNVSGIKASFVLCQIGEKIYISARSLGEINVQVIMEKLGGGGHQTVSGAQVINAELDETKENLKLIIKHYIQEVS